MTNVKSSNLKLKERSLRILMAETALDKTTAENLMKEAREDLRVALVMFRTDVNRQTAERSLSENDFVVEKTVNQLSQ
jgi:N-acetylmuramic acid 6-phosphate etherase